MNTLSPNPVSIINADGRSGWLLVCEHAGNQIPKQLKHLGLTDTALETHIAYDIGAYEMTLALSEQLDATAIVGHYSRLVIDCNRSLAVADCIPEQSDGIIIPGNQQLSDSERLWRIEQIYQPFHRCVSHVLAQKLASNPRLKFANIHSFTPMLATEGKARPWDIGFIYREPEPSRQMIRHLSKHSNYVIGDNQPYNGFIHRGYTLTAHAEAHLLPHFLVEFRQDHINHANGIAHWAQVLMTVMRDV